MSLDDIKVAIALQDAAIGRGEPVSEADRHDPLGWCEANGIDETDAEVRALLVEMKFREDVQRELYHQRVREAAKAAIRAEIAAAVAMPPILGLDELLAKQLEPVKYRITGLWPRNGRVVLAAQFKAGKSTTNGNLIRSLVDGDPFLDHFRVERLRAGTVVLLDTELSEQLLQEWFDDQRIVDTDRVKVVPMRGRTASFDILDPERRATWVKILRNLDAKIVILDCLGPVLAALGLNEKEGLDVGRFLVALDALLDEAGIEEALIIHHMGHEAERSRGASRLRDWPDAEWKLVRLKDEDENDVSHDSPRYFSALGRDVGVSESLLAYDPSNRHLSLVGGNRKAGKGIKHVEAVVAYVAGHPDLSQNKLEDGLKGSVDRDAVRSAIGHALKQGRLCIHPGPRKSNLHRVKDDCADCAGLRAAQSDDCATAPIGGAVQSVVSPPIPLPRSRGELASCTVCLGPLDDIERTGQHPTCERRAS